MVHRRHGGHGGVAGHGVGQWWLTRLPLFPLAMTPFAAVRPRLITSRRRPALCCTAAWHRQRSALPPDAVLDVSLLDVSRADAQATVLAHQTIDSAGQVPIAFVLEYDTAQIKPQMSYVVQATIRQGGKLLFINTERFAVLTRGAPQDKVRVRVDPV